MRDREGRVSSKFSDADAYHRVLAVIVIRLDIYCSKSIVIN